MNDSKRPPEVITYDYQFAPNAQKSRSLLNACGIPFQICEQPFTQPRPILSDLGINYRRIPVNAIGKDFYCDNRTFFEAIQTIFPDKAKALPANPADHAFESFGYRTFWVCLPLVPVDLNTKELQNDRSELYKVFQRNDYAELRPSALAELKHFMDIVETEFLADGPFINGDTIGFADLHAMWVIKWALEMLGVAKESGFAQTDFPKVYAWVGSVPKHIPEIEGEKIHAKDAKEAILNAGYAATDIGIDGSDPTGLKKGDIVTVTPNDDDVPQNTLQNGRLVGLSSREIVIELENTIRLHFPRIGYVLKKA